MPEKRTMERARKDARAGKAPSTQAGEFVREEMHHVREGKHGARSSKQAIAIGLSNARRAGVKLGRNPSGRTNKATKHEISYWSMIAFSTWSGTFCAGSNTRVTCPRLSTLAGQGSREQIVSHILRDSPAPLLSHWRMGDPSQHGFG